MYILLRCMYEPMNGLVPEIWRSRNASNNNKKIKNKKIKYPTKMYEFVYWQHFSVWDWTVEAESPICMAELSPSFGVQRYIYFNPEDKSQVVTNSDSQVIFYAWVGGWSG